MSYLQKRPVLFHASPHALAGDFLEPRPNRTCAFHEHYGKPTQPEHEGDFLFAGGNLVTAHAYAYKLSDPVRQEDGLPYCYMAGVSSLALADDQHLTCAFIADRGDYLSLLAKAQPTIYRMPPSHPFREVLRADGTGTGEYVTRTPVAADDCHAIKLDSLDNGMKLGVQFFFLRDGISKGQWYDLTQAAHERMTAEIGPYRADPDYGQKAASHYFGFLNDMLKQGVLTHYNREQGMCPFDLQSQSFPAGQQPTQFAAKAGGGQGRQIG